MRTRRHLGAAVLACALGACTFHGGGNRSAAPASPPRLSVGPGEPKGTVGQLSLCGLTILGNVDDLHFRMELSGERVGLRKGSPDYFVVDGLKIRVATVLADQISPTARGLRGIDLLRTHARFECARLADTLGRDTQPEEIAVLTSNNMPAGLAWWLPLATAAEEPKEQAPTLAPPAPGGYPAAPPVVESPVPPAAESPAPPAAPAATEPRHSSGIAYMTAAYGPRVVVLSVQGEHDEPQAVLVAKAQAWMGTLTTSPYPISASALKQEADAARAAGQSCPGHPHAIWEP